jgi:hypothetical protein
MSEIPSNYELLILINKLSNEIQLLKQENKELNVKIENIQKINNSNLKKSFTVIQQKLNEKLLPSILFDDWIEHVFSLIPSKLEIVFENDLLKGIFSLLNESIENIEYIPISAYNKKKNIFYYYNLEKGEWEILENKKFDEFIDRVCYHFLKEFKICWYDVNIQKINTQEEYKILYNSYYMKILGSEKMSDETFHNRIRTHFYNLIKENI